MSRGVLISVPAKVIDDLLKVKEKTDMKIRGKLDKLAELQARSENGADVDDKIDELEDQLEDLRCEVEEKLIEKIGTIYSSTPEGYLLDLDKSWDGIHRCLSNTIIFDDEGEQPLSMCILGGFDVFDDEYEGDQIIRLIGLEQTKAVAEALPGINEQIFRERYERLDAPESLFAYGGAFDYHWNAFLEVQELYHRSSRARRAMVMWADS